MCSSSETVYIYIYDTYVYEQKWDLACKYLGF